MESPARFLGTYNDGAHTRLPNSLPVVGRALAGEIIAERRLEEPGGTPGACWATRPPRPLHAYVRALFAVINSGGTRAAVVVCGHCGQGRQTVSYRRLSDHGVSVNDLPLLADYRRDYCTRCGALGAQLHHMAPSAIFADADDWPLAYLCQACHAEWHKTMGKT